MVEIKDVQTIYIEYDRGLFGIPSSESFHERLDICQLCLIKKLDKTADGRER